MKHSLDAKGLRIEAAAYRLTLHADRPYATLADADGQRWAELFLGSSLHTRGELDDTAHLEPPAVEEADGLVRVTVAAEGNLWREKRLVFVYYEVWGMTPEEIAVTVGSSTNTVRSRLHHARREFHEALARLSASESRPR